MLLEEVMADVVYRMEVMADVVWSYF